MESEERTWAVEEGCTFGQWRGVDASKIVVEA